jgi:hypothetical protein
MRLELRRRTRRGSATVTVARGARTAHGVGAANERLGQQVGVNKQPDAAEPVSAFAQ